MYHKPGDRGAGSRAPGRLRSYNSLPKKSLISRSADATESEAWTELRPLSVRILRGDRRPTPALPGQGRLPAAHIRNQGPVSVSAGRGQDEAGGQNSARTDRGYLACLNVVVPMESRSLFVPTR